MAVSAVADRAVVRAAGHGAGCMRKPHVGGRDPRRHAAKNAGYQIADAADLDAATGLTQVEFVPARFDLLLDSDEHAEIVDALRQSHDDRERHQ